MASAPMAILGHEKPHTNNEVERVWVLDPVWLLSHDVAWRWALMAVSGASQCSSFFYVKWE